MAIRGARGHDRGVQALKRDPAPSIDGDSITPGPLPPPCRRRALSLLASLVVATAAVAGCIGKVGGGGPGPGPGPGPGTETVPAGTDPGRVTLHRLNRVEYNNTVRDLLGTALRPADEFPSDNRGYGFDNVADSLTLAPVQIELYETAAERLAQEALGAARARVVPCDPAVDPACARTAVEGFARRAWRRPPTDEELARLMALVDLAKAEGDTVDVGLKLAIQAVLQSPKFVFRVELDPAPDALEPHALTSWELASRLSYFLWSSMPDDALLAAAEGDLNQPDAITGEVRRMLADPKARALIENLAGQWLYLRKLEEQTPSPTLFPSFDPALRRAMRAEAELTFQELLAGNIGLPELLTAPFAFVNDRLATHYGLPAPGSAETSVRVSLDGVPRRGLLTQGFFLTVTSHVDRTSPVLRGKWVLDQLLCTPPMDPPPNTPTLPREPMPSASLRERLDAHRTNEVCAACHRYMDPVGLAFENYDAIGVYRADDGGLAINPAGELPDGRSFQGPLELAEVLAADPRYIPCVIDKIYTYALGRPPDRVTAKHMDPGVLASIAERLAADGQRLPQMLEMIATSQTFRFRRGESETPGGAP
jgi:hypothetical protein